VPIKHAVKTRCHRRDALVRATVHKTQSTQPAGEKQQCVKTGSRIKCDARDSSGVSGGRETEGIFRRRDSEHSHPQQQCPRSGRHLPATGSERECFPGNDHNKRRILRMRSRATVPSSIAR